MRRVGGVVVMKFVGSVALLVVVIAGAGAPLHAQKSCYVPLGANFGGNLASDAPLQTGRVFRGGENTSAYCGGTSPAATLTDNALQFRYAANEFIMPATGCFTVEISSAADCGQIYLAIYTAFDPAHPESNVVAQHGASSTTPGRPVSTGVLVNSGQHLTAVVSATTPAGTCSAYTLLLSIANDCRVPGFDTTHDGFADPAVFRPSTGTWYASNSAGVFVARTFGLNGDIPMPGEYANLGGTDVAVYRPSTSTWYVDAEDGFSGVVWGQAGDVPVLTDGDLDGRADLTVFRPSNGVWFTRRTRAGDVRAMAWGTNGDIPVRMDVDGDLQTDFAVARPAGGSLQWYIKPSDRDTGRGLQFGLATDIPVPADYDGDLLTDVAVFRPGTGTWYYQSSATGTIVGFTFGAPGDVPQPVDVDGDGKADFVVFRDSATPGQSTWYGWRSATQTLAVMQWGTTGDRPVTAPFRVQ